MEYENLNEQEIRQAGIDNPTAKHPKYAIGTYSHGKDSFTYFFGIRVDGIFEVMLSKTIRDEEEFKQEVENLTKYFNADVISKEG